VAGAAWVPQPVPLHDLGGLDATVVGVSAANALVGPIVVRFLVPGGSCAERSVLVPGAA